MLRIIIRVRREGEAQVFDAEVPAEVPAEQLSDMLARAFNWERTKTGQLTGYTLVKGGTDQVLRSQETLADVGLWEGAEILLRPKAGVPEKVRHPAVLESSTRRYLLIFPKMQVGRSAAGDEDAAAQLDLIDLRDEQEGKTVSRNHALVIYANGDWSIVPSGNTQNTTTVNDRDVEPARPYQLLDGDQVQLGGVRLVFHLDQETAST